MEASGMNGKFLQLVAHETGLDAERLSLDTSIEEIGLDSLEFLELLLAIGEAYHTIPDSAIPKIHTLGDILTALEVPANA